MPHTSTNRRAAIDFNRKQVGTSFIQCRWLLMPFQDRRELYQHIWDTIVISVCEEALLQSPLMIYDPGGLQKYHFLNKDWATSLGCFLLLMTSLPWRSSFSSNVSQSVDCDSFEDLKAFKRGHVTLAKAELVSSVLPGKELYLLATSTCTSPGTMIYLSLLLIGWY